SKPTREQPTRTPASAMTTPLPPSTSAAAWSTTGSVWCSTTPGSPSGSADRPGQHAAAARAVGWPQGVGNGGYNCQVASLPTLVVISGPVGAGKTTLAHQLARAVGCPAICRDEIKEGMAHASPGFVPAPGDELTARTLPVFFGVVELLL